MAGVAEVTSSRRERRRESGYLSNATKTPDVILDIKEELQEEEAEAELKEEDNVEDEEDGRSSPFLVNLRRETMSDPEETEDMAGWQQGGKWYRKI